MPHRWRMMFALACLTTFCPPVRAEHFTGAGKSVAWFKSDEGRRAADNTLTWQFASGAFPKNIDTGKEPCPNSDREKFRKSNWETIDNGATCSQLRIRRYIRDSRAAGATPVLITPMTRRRFAADGKTVVTILRPYAEAMLAVAREEKAACIDLHAKSVALLESLGDDGSAYLSPGTDRTHFSPQGARKMAELVVQDLSTVEPTLAPCIKTGAAAER